MSTRRENEAALIKAVCKGQEAVVRTLLGDGVAVEARNERGWPALYIASFYGELGCVKALLEAGADPNAREPEGQTAIIATKKAEVTRTLLEAGADANAQDINGLTALDCAITSADVEQVQLLLAHGARVPKEMGSAEYWSIFASRTEPVRRAIFAHLTAARIENAMEELPAEQSRRSEVSPL